MAEIRVAPQRRNRALGWILLIVIVLAAIAAWYFLAGPGAAAATGASTAGMVRSAPTVSTGV